MQKQIIQNAIFIIKRTELKDYTLIILSLKIGRNSLMKSLE
ncbi:hypothetical protein PROVRUST_07014 [Providencia rustigianii DSM 4541]|uniref:Uncharacterized protein n=1 Tax=Providencia rustigianii DSM 4541 TaxID=500637 RepID=D1P463_9GAMM|nr:hypothetical protein PROVRUST_07014 [Providencia rustigianii DSM 4541]